MREIRFRAWDKQNNQMIVESAVLFPIIGPQLNEGVPYRWWELMQYTGLKDKNEKEIYEGDIVYASLNGGTYIMKLGLYTHEHTDDFDRNFSANGFYLERIPGGFCESACNSEVIEVIGNVHENPELLEVKP